MRVLEIVADGDPGGGTTHVLQILRSLHQNCQLGLVTQTGSYLLREARALGIPCFGVNFFRSRLDPWIPLKLHRIVDDFDPHVVHVHGGRAAFFHAFSVTRVPTVYTVHGYHFRHKPSFVMRWLAMNAERIAAHSADYVIFVSRYEARLAQDYKLVSKRTHSAVIYNGVSLTNIPRARPESTKHIGFIGRLEYQKDPILFLDILERLPGYTATIVGGGTLEAAVRTEVKRRRLSRVRITGSLSHSEALAELARCGSVVITSRWEAFAYLPAEAMECGVPVVAMNVGGLGEVVEHERTGILVDNRSADALAQAVVRATQDEEFRRRIIENARSRVRTVFTEEKMISRIQEVYKTMATS